MRSINCKLAIAQAAKARQIAFVKTRNVASLPGQGIVGEVDNQKAVVGKAAFFQEYAQDSPEALLPSWSKHKVVTLVSTSTFSDVRNLNVWCVSLRHNTPYFKFIFLHIH